MGTPTLPNIDLIKSAFDTANNDLVVAAKANRVTTPDTAAAARPIAQWGNLVDNLLRKFQLRAARSGRSVLEHGAVGDGTTSDATAFQDAIDAVDADGGGKVLVPPPPTSYVIGTPTLRSGVRLHYTDSGDPNGKAYGTDGDRYTRTDGAVTEYVKTGGAGTSGWTDMAAAAAPDLETVLASGNTVDDTQSIDYVDDFDVVRAKSDYDVASGLQRLRTFTSGAVLSATLAIATATGLLTYDGPVELSGTLGAPAALDLVINPGSDAGKQLVLDGLRWPEADGTANQVLATDGAANLIWKTDFASAAGTVAGSMLIWGGSAWVENTSIIAQPDGRLAVAGGATADASPSSDDFVVGNLASSAVGLTLLSDTGGIARFAATDTSTVISGELRYTHGSGWRVLSEGGPVADFLGAVVQPVNDDAITLGAVGNRWSDFHAMTATIYGTTTLSGTGANLTVQGTGTSTFAGNVSLTGATTTLTIGDGSGAGTLVTDGEGSAARVHWRVRSDLATVWTWSLLTSDTYKITNQVTGANFDFQATGDFNVNAGDINVTAGNLALNAASPTETIGDGTGSPGQDFDKLGTGTSILRFLNAGVDSIRLIHKTDEDFAIQWWDGISAYQPGIRLDAANGNVFVDQALSIGQDNAQLNMGTGSGSPLIAMRAVATGTATIELGSGNYKIVSSLINTQLEAVIAGTQEYVFKATAFTPSNGTAKSLGESGTGLGFTGLYLTDGVTAPATPTGSAVIYVDTADGQLKVKDSAGNVEALTTTL